MAKATESASLSVEPKRTETRSWLRLPQPCLVAWLRNCRRRIRLKGPDAHRSAPKQSPPSISWWQTRPGRQSLVKTVAAGGGGRRPVFTRDCHPATLGHRGRRSSVHVAASLVGQKNAHTPPPILLRSTFSA